MNMTHTYDDVPGTLPRILRKIDFVGKKGADDYMTYSEPVVADVNDANVVTSALHRSSTALSRAADADDSELTHDKTMHAPVIDLDLPCELIESSTPGHFHLVIDAQISWRHYLDILETLSEAGIVQRGYMDASRQRGYSSIRLPWVPKEDENLAGAPEAPQEAAQAPAEVNDDFLAPL